MVRELETHEGIVRMRPSLRSSPPTLDSMFKRCCELSETLGDDVSIFMRATYLYNLAGCYLDQGYYLDCMNIGHAGLKLLGEDSQVSTLGLTSEIFSLAWRDWYGSCLSGQQRPLVDGVEEELAIKLYVVVAFGSSLLGRGPAALFGVTKAINLAARFDLVPYLSDDGNEALSHRDTVILLAVANASLSFLQVVAGFRSLAAAALSRSLELTSGITIFGEFRLYLTRGMALFADARFEEGMVLCQKLCSEAEELGSRTWFITGAIVNVQIMLNLLNMESCAVLAHKLEGILSQTFVSAQQQGWILITLVMQNIYLGNKESLAKAIKLGKDYCELTATKEFIEQTGRRHPSTSDIHVLAFAWCGHYRAAADMLLPMLDDWRSRTTPSKPSDGPFYMWPAFTTALLLCVARESMDESGTLQFREEQVRGTEDNKMTPEQVRQLTGAASTAAKLGERFSAVFLFGETLTMITTALLSYGLGGSAATAAASMITAAETSLSCGMPFEAALAFFYAAVLKNKEEGQDKSEVVKLLRSVVKTHPSQNYALHRARRGLEAMGESSVIPKEPQRKTSLEAQMLTHKRWMSSTLSIELATTGHERQGSGPTRRRGSTANALTAATFFFNAPTEAD